LTVKVASGDASRWQGLRRVLLDGDIGPDGAGESREVERARFYRDRLVLKLRGVDGADAANALRGRLILAPPEEVPALPEGVHYAARLVGLAVSDETVGPLGKIVDVAGIGGADLLVVEDEEGKEILVPFARDIVREVSERDGVVRVRLPEGLAGLNRGGGDAS
jgi:16S rRNA processing protein RimM